MLKEVTISQGVEVRKEGNDLVIKGPKGELRRDVKHPKVKIDIKGDSIVLDSVDDRRRSKAMTGTLAAHVKNMVDGVDRGYESRLRVVYSHFPVRLKAEGDSFIIENFLGEKKPRVAKIEPGTEVKVEKDDIIVTGIDKEKVGITASRIEQTTKVIGFDRRVFSDGAYITQKPTAVEESQKVEPQKEEQAKEDDGDKE